MDGMNQSFDRREVNRVLTLEEEDALCTRLYSHAMDLASEPEKEKMRRIGRSQLISWGLIAEEHGVDYATNGYQLLDGKLEQYEDAVIQCAVFKGTDRANFITRKEFAGPIDQEIEDAYAFVLQNIRLGSRIEGLARQDFYELPIKSIREMIANAVCHRSYLAPQKIQVALYDDRLEVTTPGMLGRDITITKMELGQSLIRNKGIAAAFAYMNIIEGWGSGIPRILQEAEEFHLQRPELIDMGGSFRMNLFRRDFETDQYGVIDPKNGANQTSNQTNQTSNQTNRIDYPELTEIDRLILLTIKSNSKVTQREIAEKIERPLGSVKYICSKLTKHHMIRHVGTIHNGYWEILVEDSVWQN
ncbi:MAG: winged helix-turn-helix transcriptional regulator [Oscillospiraceae bacterium]|nr:winged helix-turn-helix transcriptional regulator [Oscillospiraceae bacterium]